MADKISQEGTLKDKGPRISDWSLRTTSRAEQSLLTGRKPRVSGKGDEELLNGLSTTGAYRQQTRDRPPEKAQKHILGVQGQNQAWKYPLASALVGNVGSKEDSCRIIGTGGRLRETRVQWQRIQKTWTAQHLLCLRIHCQDFFLDLPVCRRVPTENKTWVVDHLSQQNTSLWGWLDTCKVLRELLPLSQSDFLSSLAACGHQGDPWWWDKEDATHIQ